MTLLSENSFLVARTVVFSAQTPLYELEKTAAL